MDPGRFVEILVVLLLLSSVLFYTAVDMPVVNPTSEIEVDSDVLNHDAVWSSDDQLP